MVKKTIGEILLEQKLITLEQLNAALEEEKNTKVDSGQILLKKEIITKATLAKALAYQMSLPYVDKIAENMVNTELLGSIPLKFLRQHMVMPIVIEGRKVVVTANPRDLQPLDDLALLLKGDVQYAVAAQDIISDGINKYYPLETGKEAMEELKEEEGEIALEEIEEKDILEMAQEAPIVKLVNHILYQAVKEEASDIHIEPYEKELRVRYRIDGVMYQKVLPPKRYQGAIVSRIKIMSNLNIAEKRIPQDGRIQIKVAEKAIDVRVSILPCNYGERVSMRLLDKTKGAVAVEKLGLSERDFGILNRIIERPNGIILVTGPTGSGKTTTLYSVLGKLNQPDCNIITVEDPVEYTIHGVNQVHVNEKVGLTFAAALRSILRQDPDIIMIGEMRDKETAQIAIQAALTGHLVLSTLHTNSASATITRLVDMGVEPYLIASTLICIAAQRLVRRLCDKCKKQYKPNPEMLQRLGLKLEETSQIAFYEPGGCDECLQSGYKGRLPIFEVLEITDEIRPLIVQGADASVIRRKTQELGVTFLLDDGIRRIKEGITTIDEVLGVAFTEEESIPKPSSSDGNIGNTGQGGTPSNQQPPNPQQQNVPPQKPTTTPPPPTQKPATPSTPAEPPKKPAS
jgi:general secretion pathway protein E